MISTTIIGEDLRSPILLDFSPVDYTKCWFHGWILSAKGNTDYAATVQMFMCLKWRVEEGEDSKGDDVETEVSFSFAEDKTFNTHLM